MADQLKVGDVVELKSGGPQMTIEAIDTYGTDREKAGCVWFNKTDRKTAVFELDTLVKKEKVKI